MVRVEINPHDPQVRHIKRAADELARGSVICYPTDTIYGIGCDIFNKKAIERIYRIKGKGFKAPLSFICSDLSNIAEYAHVSNYAYKVMRRCLPGPYTFVLPATRLVPKIMMSKRKTVGIRVPDNAICHALLELFGKPIISTSASLHDGQVLHFPEDIEHHLNTFIDFFLDSGPLGMDSSTVLDLTGEKLVILREGKGLDKLPV